MKKIAFYLFLLVALLPGVCLADKSKSKSKEPDTRFLVSSVDLQKHTIDVMHQEKGIAVTYLVTSQTTIEINDKDASFKSVKVGMEVKSCRLAMGEDSPQVLEDLDLKSGS